MIPQADKPIGEHETKFVLPNIRAVKVTSWLKKRCDPDPKFSKGRVSSIYYDSRNWVYLGEKINSDYLKTKIRLRWYSEIETGALFPSTFLEVKSKIGSARKKFRQLLDVESAMVAKTPLNDLMFVRLIKKVEQNNILPKKILLPVYQINYQRYRFIEPITGSRLCVDQNIHVSRVNPMMICKKNPVVLKDAVFEIKGKVDQLPQWLNQLTSFGCRRGAFSKYSCCYLQLKRLIT